MNEFKVKEVSADHSSKKNEVVVDVNEVKDPVVVPEDGKAPVVVPESKEENVISLKEEDVLTYIADNFEWKVESMEDLRDRLTNPKKNEVVLPENVSTYLKYHQETGRSMDDFLKINRDVATIAEDELLKDYFLATQKGIDKEDIPLLMDEFSYDEDVDDDKVIAKKKLDKKQMIASARDYFETQKEKYKVPLESRTESISAEQKEQLEHFQEYVNQSVTLEEEARRKTAWFNKKTEEVFENEFKGFEFNVDENKKIVFSPGEASEILSSHKNPGEFLKKFLNKDGLLEDATGYHATLAVAMNPEKFAKFCYEQGRSNAIDEGIRSDKNIDMGFRKTPQSVGKEGLKVREVKPDSGNRLKITNNK